ncbi:MAG: segregation/condensation protein A [Clostridia bacterium]|nr:segregation/condensation protein A [Clostridia bacterium]
MGVLTLETNKYALKLENFEGPLDLLCHLIDKNKMDIYDVKLSDIADQYIEYINEMEKQNLDITSEFLVIASTLVYLKSKELLPKENEDEAELTEEELIRRIIEYKKYKEISKKFNIMYKENIKRFYKLPESIELPKQKLEKEYSKDIIYNNYEKLINKQKVKMNQNAKNIEKIALIENYTVTSKVREIFKELSKKPKFVFNKLFSTKTRPKVEIVTAFTGVLELTRKNKVTTHQEELFGEIVVEKAKTNNK